ncbi:hypothetical protein J4440_04895 [Candidatus Woesearchaeota archaeon]|nr:hypothetical protein [Candidatus Woesearchaeota archaeon]
MRLIKLLLFLFLILIILFSSVSIYSDISKASIKKIDNIHQNQGNIFLEVGKTNLINGESK